MANASELAASASLAPDNPQKDELLVSGDRNFAVHGEITMLVVVLLFIFFLLFIIYVLCLNRQNNAPNLNQSEPVSPRNYSIAMLKGKMKGDQSNLMHQFEDCRRTHQPVSQ